VPVLLHDFHARRRHADPVLLCLDFLQNADDHIPAPCAMLVLVDMRTICVHWQKAYHKRTRVAKFIKSFVNAGLARVAARVAFGAKSMRIRVRLFLESFVSILWDSFRNTGA
jgi:hypothetical protein